MQRDSSATARHSRDRCFREFIIYNVCKYELQVVSRARYQQQ